MSVSNAQAKIRQEMLSLAGVEAQPHRFGGVEFVLGCREIGHIHGNRLVDIPFPTKIRDELLAQGRAKAHHVLPDSGWVTFYIRQPEDVDAAIALLRYSYELAQRQRQR